MVKTEHNLTQVSDSGTNTTGLTPQLDTILKQCFQNIAYLFGFRFCPGDVVTVRDVIAVLAEDGLEVVFILSQSLHLKQRTPDCAYFLKC
jgi:hypothetical protein